MTATMNLAILVLICCSVVVNANAAAAAAGNHALLLNSDEAGVEEVEFLMESGSSMRMLQQGSKNLYGNFNTGANYNCGRNKIYCLSDRKNRELYCDSRQKSKACHPPS